jgi:hypothetical protein
MTDTLRDMMAARADAAPGPQIDVDGVIRVGRRRVWRNRAAGGTAACAALVAVALVVPTLSFGGDDEPGIAGSGGFEARKVTYAQGSTIHYGDAMIDVPTDVRTFVQTDDGFVFTDAHDRVYFTNGDETTEIGHAGGPVWAGDLRADHSGSYVAWVEIDDGERPETIVYDTSAGREVLRTDEGNGPGPGYYGNDDKPLVLALDGELLFVQDSKGQVAIDIPTGRSTTLFGPKDDRYFIDAANGRIALSDVDGVLAIRTGIDGEEQRFPRYQAAQLSPSGTRVWTSRASSDIGYVEILDVSSRTLATLARGDDVFVNLSQWVDDDTVVVHRYGVRGPIDLLRCSVSSGDCEVAVASLSREGTRFPLGFTYNPEEGW